MRRPIIISDFDGTITTKDTNVAIWSYFNYKESEKLRDIYRNNEELGMRWLLTEEYKRLKISRKDLKDFIQHNMEIEVTFKSFLDYIKENDYKFSIISGGFIDYIEIILKHFDINIDFPIHANNLIFPEDENSNNNKIVTKFIKSKKNYNKKIGQTSTPKGEIISKYNRKYSPVIYLGDGRTDRHAVDYSDFIFTKKDSYFEKFCAEHNYEHFIFEDFNQAKKIIEEIIK